MDSLSLTPAPAATARPRALRRVTPGCPACGFELDPAVMVAGEQTCPVCRRTFLATPFVPPEIPVRVRSLAEIGAEEAAACGRHGGNAAVGSCARCGVFVCDLCRTDIDGQVLCPGCFDRLTAEGALSSSRQPLRDYRGLALQMGVLGLFLSCFGLVTGPFTIWCAVRALRQKKQLEETGGTVAIVIAILLGLAQIAFGILIPVGMFKT
jgi:hypothetical protein